MAYGQESGLTYLIPQKFLRSTVDAPNVTAESYQPAATPGQNIVHPLAERERLTDDYYNNYAALDTFAKDMARKGINVFEPDYSQPGGGEGFKTFQRMQANVMHAANALRNEFEMEKEIRRLEGEGKARMRTNAKREGLYYSRPENFYSTAISPEVEEANKSIRQETNTAQDAANVNAALRMPELRHLQEVRKKFIAEGKPTEEIDQDIAALSTNVARQDPSVMAAYVRKIGGSGANKYDTSIFKKMYNIGSAAWQPGTYKILPHSKHGAVWAYDGLKGDRYGEVNVQTDKGTLRKDKIIKTVYANPKDNEVWVSFQDPSIPDEVVDDPYHFAENVISSNKKHGDFNRTMKAVFEEGMGDEESGGVIPSKVLDPNMGAYHQLMHREMGKRSQQIGAVQQTDRDILKELQERWYGNQSKEFQTPNGVITVKRQNKDADTFKITNWQDLFPDAEDSSQFEGLKADQVIQILTERGKYDKYDAQETPAPEQEKTFIYKGKPRTTAELKAAGWTDNAIAKGLTDGTLK